jgi:hypothetical protein
MWSSEGAELKHHLIYSNIILSPLYLYYVKTLSEDRIDFGPDYVNKLRGTIRGGAHNSRTYRI